jgi:hypothetical protein
LIELRNLDFKNIWGLYLEGAGAGGLRPQQNIDSFGWRPQMALLA